MIDMVNVIVVAACCAALGLLIYRRRGRLRVALAAAAAFAAGLAIHSVYLHERLRHRWRLPWDHEEGQP